MADPEKLSPREIERLVLKAKRKADEEARRQIAQAEATKPQLVSEPTRPRRTIGSRRYWISTAAGVAMFLAGITIPLYDYASRNIYAEPSLSIPSRPYLPPDNPANVLNNLMIDFENFNNRASQAERTALTVVASALVAGVGVYIFRKRPFDIEPEEESKPPSS